MIQPDINKNKTKKPKIQKIGVKIKEYTMKKFLTDFKNKNQVTDDSFFYCPTYHG